jgi:hypothetical protein
MLGLPCVSGNSPHFSRPLRKFASRRAPLRACMREPCLWPRDTGPLLQNDNAWSPRESMGASHFREELRITNTVVVITLLYVSNRFVLSEDKIYRKVVRRSCRKPILGTYCSVT